MTLNKFYEKAVRDLDITLDQSRLMFNISLALETFLQKEKLMSAQMRLNAPQGSAKNLSPAIK